MSSLTFYSAAGAVSPADGIVARDSVNESFSTIRNGSGNTAGDNAAIGADRFLLAQLSASATTNQFSNIYRSILCFDTSAIPDDAIILSATLSIYGGLKSNNLGSPDLHVCSAAPASTAGFAASDYGNLGNTSFGSIAYGSINIGSYNDINLNAAGLANISKTGITKFGVRLSWDINNSFTGSWVSGSGSSIMFYAADEAGTSSDPKLTVTYIVYDTTKNLAQSNALNSNNSAMIATVTLTPTESLPASTSIDYAMQGDSGSGFVSVPKNTESVLALPALSGNASHKWRSTLNGLTSATPVLSGLSIAYRKAMPLAATTDRLAQSFNSGAGGSIAMVLLNIVKDLSDSINYTVEIQTDNAGSPSGTVVTNGSATIAAANVPNQAGGGSFSWVAAIFGTPPTLSASTTYWIVVKVSSAGSSKLIWRARGGNSYSSGAAKFSTNSGSAWTAMTNDDFLFQVLAGGGTFQANITAKYKRRYR